MEGLLDQRAYRIVCVLVFASLLFAPLIGRLAGIGSDVAEIELRRPHPPPDLPTSLATLRRFAKRAEKHLDDSFGFRSQLVTAHSLVHRALGVSGSPKYILGKRGWYYHREIEDVLDQARGISHFSPPELERWIATMEARQRGLAAQGIDFLVVIAPNKHAIYPEYLPDWATQVGVTRYEQLRARLADSALQVLDAHEILRRAKASEPVYFRTDGHWNDLGAFLVYREILAWIQARHPEVEGLERSDFELRWVDRSVGTISRGLNLLGFETEPVPELALLEPSKVVRKSISGPGPPWGGGKIFVSETDRPELPDVLFIRDSYSEPLANFLQESMNRTLRIHHRGGRFDWSDIARHQPDIVIYEMVERELQLTLVDVNGPGPKPKRSTK